VGSDDSVTGPHLWATLAVNRLKTHSRGVRTWWVLYRSELVTGTDTRRPHET